MKTFGGIVLCGGESSRMGRPKAWLPFGNKVMLQRVVRIVSEVVQPVVVVAASGQKLPPLPGGVLRAEDADKGRGPLQGLAAGLGTLEGKCDMAFVTSCDVPFLKPAFIRRLIELLEEQTICVPHVNERYHPLPAVYRLSIAEVVQRFLAENRLRLLDLLDEVPTRAVAKHELLDVDPDLQSLRNINTWAEYETALRDAAFTPGEIADPDRDV